MGIATIDLSQLLGDSPLDPQRCGELLHSCSKYGFVKCVGHGISADEINSVFAWSRALFAWPDEVKRSAARATKGPYRGYAGVGQERIGAISGHVKGMRGVANVADIKECFDFGNPADSVYPTPWPRTAQTDELRRHMHAFYRNCAIVHAKLLGLLEQALGLPRGELNALCSDSNGEVRLTHYPPVEASLLKTGKTYRIAEHTDVGVLTLLFQDSVGGLEIEEPGRAASFVPVESASTNEMIVNIADTLQRWTNGHLRSTNHRVLAPVSSGEQKILPARYSVGYFGKANQTANMVPLRSFTSGSDRHELEEDQHLSAQEYYNSLHERTSTFMAEQTQA